MLVTAIGQIFSKNLLELAIAPIKINDKIMFTLYQNQSFAWIDNLTNHIWSIQVDDKQHLHPHHPSVHHKQ
jgi:hypothetical protein